MYLIRASLDVAACLAALFEIALVVLLCAPEGLGRLNFRDDRLRTEAALGGKLLDFGAGLRVLLGRVKEDSRAVLRTPIGALAVEGSGIVEGKEGVQKLFEADFFSIEVHFDHLGVAGQVGADVLVTGPLQRTALITGGRRRDAGDCCKRRFYSPEAAGSECCFFLAHGS